MTTCLLFLPRGRTRRFDRSVCPAHCVRSGYGCHDGKHQPSPCALLRCRSIAARANYHVEVQRVTGTLPHSDDEMTCSSLGRGAAGMLRQKLSQPPPIDRMPGCLPDAFRRVARTCTWPAVASRATLRMVRTALPNAQLESDLCPAAANPNRSDACLNSTGSKAVKIKGRKPI